MHDMSDDELLTIARGADARRFAAQATVSMCLTEWRRRGHSGSSFGRQLWGDHDPDPERAPESAVRGRCGEPHPHYSAMSCYREPGHEGAHSYGVPSHESVEQESS